MAKNRVQQDGYHMSVTPSSPATPLSGDPFRWGSKTAIALTNVSEGGNPTGKVTGDFSCSSWNVPVKGVDGAGNSAVADGDLIYFVDGDAPPLSKKATGVLFGTARAAVTAGATATIEVRHDPQ